MPMASRPPLRASAALALAVYALVLLAGPALMHAFACSGHGAPHCLICASVESVSSSPEAAASLGGDTSDAGTVATIGSPRDGVCVLSPGVNRAPPTL